MVNSMYLSAFDLPKKREIQFWARVGKFVVRINILVSLKRVLLCGFSDVVFVQVWSVDRKIFEI